MTSEAFWTSVWKRASLRRSWIPSVMTSRSKAISAWAAMISIDRRMSAGMVDAARRHDEPLLVPLGAAQRAHDEVFDVGPVDRLPQRRPGGDDVSRRFPLDQAVVQT